MPIQIDEVHSDVTVDPAASPGAAVPGRNLPTADELRRHGQLARRVACDAARTAARDQDD